MKITVSKAWEKDIYLVIALDNGYMRKSKRKYVTRTSAYFHKPIVYWRIRHWINKGFIVLKEKNNE